MQEQSDVNFTHIGKVIHKHRMEMKITQQELADLCGLSYNTLRRIKTSENSINIDTAIRIADVLKIPLDELVGRDGYRMYSEADRVTVTSLESRLAEQAQTIESQKHTISLLEKDIEGKSQLIDSHTKTIYEQRRSIRRNDIFRNCLLAAFVLAVFVLWFVQI